MGFSIAELRCRTKQQLTQFLSARLTDSLDLRLPPPVIKTLLIGYPSFPPVRCGFELGCNRRPDCGEHTAAPLRTGAVS
jgi:hypothetical protein